MNRYSRTLLMQIALIEGGLLGIALLWSLIRKIPWDVLSLPTGRQTLLGIGSGVFLIGVNYVIIEYGSRYVGFLRDLKHLIIHDVSPLFRNVSILAALLIALISGFAEEIFFRGVLQQQFGVLAASLVFGLAHVWRKTAFLYGIYAAIIGLYFGGLYALTQNIWVPILSHSVNNAVAMLYYMTYPTHSQSSILSHDRHSL